MRLALLILMTLSLAGCSGGGVLGFLGRIAEGSVFVRHEPVDLPPDASAFPPFHDPRGD